MSALRRFFILYLAFTVEIQIVSASEKAHSHAKAQPASENWLSEPQNCNPGEANCSILVKRAKIALVWGDSALGAASQSVMWWESKDLLRLIRGKLLVQLKNQKRIDVALGEITGEALVLFDRSIERTQVIVLEGEAKVRPLGTKEDLLLPAGYSLTFNGVNQKGIAEVDVPQSAPPVRTVQLWWQVFDGSKDSFMKLAKEFLHLAPTRADLAGDWHHRLIERTVASQIENERKQQAIRQIEQKEQAKMRALFRKMNYLDDEVP